MSFSKVVYRCRFKCRRFGVLVFLGRLVAVVRHALVANALQADFAEHSARPRLKIKTKEKP